MRVWFGIAAIALVSACGVDGEPIPPGDEDVAQPVQTSTSVVLSAGSSGVGAGVATTVHTGNVSITLGTFF